MDRKLRNAIIAKMRLLTWTLPAYKAVLARGKRKTFIGKYKNGNDKHLFKYKCNDCHNMYVRKEVEVDHIIPIVDPQVGFPMLPDKTPDFNTWIKKWNCPLNGLQILCKPCHKNKTKRERAYKKLPKI